MSVTTAHTTPEQPRPDPRMAALKDLVRAWHAGVDVDWEDICEVAENYGIDPNSINGAFGVYRLRVKREEKPE